MMRSVLREFIQSVSHLEEFAQGRNSGHMGGMCSRTPCSLQMTHYCNIYCPVSGIMVVLRRKINLCFYIHTFYGNKTKQQQR